MTTSRISTAHLVGKRSSMPRLFRHERDSLFVSRFAILAVRVICGCVFGALLFSVVVSIAAADEPTSTSTHSFHSLAAIRTVAEEFVRTHSDTNNIGGTKGDGSPTVFATATELDSRLQLTQCATALTPFTLNAAPITARTTVGVRCTSSSTGDQADAVWTVYVPVISESEIDVLVLRNSLLRDAHIASDDVTLERRRVPGLGSAYISNATLLRDQHLKRGVAAGTALMTDMLTRDLVVKRGQQVLLVFAVGGLAVQVQGLALADGGTADRIRVQNQTSLKVVEGVIESGNLVRVGM